MTELIRIRPVVEADLELQERIYEDPEDASEFGFFGHQNPGGLRRRWSDKGFLSEDDGRMAVVRGGEGRTDGEFVGEVSWHKVQHGPTSFGWNIGIGLLAKECGKGYGTIAQQLLVKYLFSHTQVNRVEAGTETTNIAEQRALEKAGFTREGIQRGACFRAGEWRDMVTYSILRAEVDLG